MKPVLVALALAALVGAVCCPPPSAVPAVYRWLTTLSTAYPHVITNPGSEGAMQSFGDFKLPAAPDMMQHPQGKLSTSASSSSCSSILATATTTYPAGNSKQQQWSASALLPLAALVVLLVLLHSRLQATRLARQQQQQQQLQQQLDSAHEALLLSQLDLAAARRAAASAKPARAEGGEHQLDAIKGELAAARLVAANATASACAAHEELAAANRVAANATARAASAEAAAAAAAAAEPSPLAMYRGLMARLAERPNLLVNTKPLLDLAAKPELMEDVQQCNVVGLERQLLRYDLSEGICSIPGVNFIDNPTVDKKNNATPESSTKKKEAKHRSVAIALVLLHRMTAAEAAGVCNVMSGALVAGSFGDACNRIYRSESITDVWEAVLDPVYSSVFEEFLADKNVKTAAFLLVSKLLNTVL